MLHMNHTRKAHATHEPREEGACYTVTTRGRHMLHIKHSNVQAKRDSDLAAASLRFTLICSDHNQFTPPYT